ncbi:MAG: hypothetical protein JRC86_04130, partial [Deltaproteobacteria bacterium]|nr:hypothetical protein [Deltaproteobacteria bacterium]
MSKIKTEPEHLGGNLIRALHQVIKAVKIHQDNNQLVIDSVSELHRLVSEMSEEQDLQIQIWRGRFYI